MLALPAELPTEPLRGQLITDSRYETDVRHPFSMEVRPCVSRVRVYAVGEGVIVVISEQHGPCRLTDTYAIEQIASEILADVVSTADRRDTVTWIAQTETGVGYFPANLPNFYEISFDRFLDEPKYIGEKTRYGVFARSTWKRIALDHLEKLIGMEWK